LYANTHPKNAKISTKIDKTLSHIIDFFCTNSQYLLSSDTAKFVDEYNETGDDVQDAIKPDALTKLKYISYSSQQPEQRKDTSIDTSGTASQYRRSNPDIATNDEKLYDVYKQTNDLVNYKYLEYAQMSDKKNTAAMLDKKTDA
jgi:hypothetical protein